MRKGILTETRFGGPSGGWEGPAEGAPGFEQARAGMVLCAADGEEIWLKGPGVHTRNGDTIEIEFRLLDGAKGRLLFGFDGGFESAAAALDFKTRRVEVRTTEWTRPQPVAKGRFRLSGRGTHKLTIDKAEGKGDLVKSADITVFLDGERILLSEGVDILPETGVKIGVGGSRVLLRRFVQRGRPSGVPEYLHVGGWQVLNKPSIGENLTSIKRGLREAAEKGVELLVTPETCLTGLFPRDKVTRRPAGVAAAERELRKFIRGLGNAPFVVVGLPIWESVRGHRLKKTRYNVSRVYDPDGGVVHTLRKIHSCEAEFHHGYRYGEFDVKGAPVCMHICHDGRYPDVWTVPVMFGARLVLHPANGGKIGGSIDAFEAKAMRSTTTSHAFHVHVNGGGGSFIAGPQKYDNLIAVSPECRREVGSFPDVGEPQEGLLHANIRIHDAFGYWPMRAFRASEDVAQSYLSLYKAMGGRRV